MSFRTCFTLLGVTTSVATLLGVTTLVFTLLGVPTSVATLLVFQLLLLHF